MDSVKAMNNKYSGKGSRDSLPFQQRKGHTGIVIIIVLVILIVVGGIFSGSAIVYRNEAQGMFISRIQSECGSALTLTNSLSRTAGTNSSAMLGKIRGHVYTMETLSDMYLALNDRSLIPDAVLDGLYLLIDEYSNKLLTGMTTGEMQSSLLSQLQSLQLIVDGL